MRRLFLRKILLALIWSFATKAQALEVKFDQIAPNVYAYVGDLEARTYQNEALNANIGLVVTSNGALLIDSGATFQSAQKIADAVRRVTPQPIRWVINTGGQDHRWLGNGFFKRQGAEIIAHMGGQADMKARGEEQLAANALFLKEKAQRTQVEFPSKWLTEANSLLDLSGVAVQVIHRNGGHTPGDVIVWLPQSRVAFAGDVVYVERMLSMLNVSNTKTWLESFSALEALAPTFVVPGHGKVGDLAQAQRDTGNLLKAVRTHMAKAIDAGSDLSAAVKSFDASPFRHLKHIETLLGRLLNLAYLEMERE